MNTSRILTVLIATAVLACSMGTANAARFSLGVQAGMRAGIGVEGNVMVKDFAEGFPMALRLAAGYSRREAGKADDARRIFINDNTGGTPEEKAWLWDLRFDFMYDFGWSSSAVFSASPRIFSTSWGVSGTGVFACGPTKSPTPEVFLTRYCVSSLSTISTRTYPG